jgi:hypothetical protein
MLTHGCAVMSFTQLTTVTFLLGQLIPKSVVEEPKDIHLLLKSCFRLWEGIHEPDIQLKLTTHRLKTLWLLATTSIKTSHPQL